MKISRRRFLGSSVLAVCGAGVLDALTEPFRIRETRLNFEHLKLGKRFVQFSDLHYKGNAGFAQKVVKRINELDPDYVFFTGDLVESMSRDHLEEALAHIETLAVPTFGVWGNHDPNDGASTQLFRASFERTGGRYIENEEVVLPGFSIFGCNHQNGLRWNKIAAETPRFLLTHFPVLADRKMENPFDLVLAGHSHGGQVRLPGLGALWLPNGVGGYDRGLFATKSGPLYVNVGVGTYLIPIRFFCRPEITVIET